MTQESRDCCTETSKGNTASFLGIILEQQNGTTYTCPMHLAVRSPQPGNCPICGMPLEPITPMPTIERDLTRANARRRLIVSILFTVSILVIAMSGMAIHWDSQRSFFAQLILSSVVLFYCGLSIFARGLQGFLRRRANMFSLITVGVSTAYCFSIVAYSWQDLFPKSLLAHGAQVPLYFEAAAVIVTLVLLGEYLELIARGKTGDAIRSLLDLSPQSAIVVRESSEIEVPVEQLKRGALIRIRPGDRIPVDGVVVKGWSSVDESMISGEAIPVEKKSDNWVTAGTLNGNGTLVVRTERLGAETVLARIVNLVSEAQRSRAPVQQLVDKIAEWFVPLVLVVAVFTFLVWFYFGPEPQLTLGLVNAVSVLIIACPCALGLATPMSIMVGVGRGATEGILIRDAEALQTFERVATLLVDKTGTLTLGKPTVSRVVSKQFTEVELITWAGSLERGSEHPLAAAILDYAKEKNISLIAVDNFRSHPGQGVTGVINGKILALGNESLLRTLKIDANEWTPDVETMRRHGETVVFLLQEQTIVGLLGIVDPIKDSSFSAIERIRERGLKVVMVTGDNELTARAVASKLQIDIIRAGVTPQEKGELVQEYQKQGQIVAMAGDGINDAGALALADVGIAMGAGADVALESAAITLVKGDLRQIDRALSLSEATMRNIRQNLALAFGYNALCIPIAAGILYPINGLLLNPMIAAAAMAFSNLSVILNALRLRSVALTKK